MSVSFPFEESFVQSVAVSERLTLTFSGFCQILHHRDPAPVIITVPHDGGVAGDFGHFAPRDKGPDGRRAIHGRDRHVWPIVNDIVQFCSARNVAVDAVRFMAPRVYIDGNRALCEAANLDPDTTQQTALDDPRLIPVYQNYFGAIGNLVTRSAERHGKERVFFIDCHGFGRQPSIAPSEGFDLILGTANRSTIRHNHSQPDKVFAAEMKARNYTVFLPGEKPVRPQGDPYSAGHTTIHTAQTYGINSMQIEIASHFRGREDTVRGQQLAKDIAGFICRHYNFG